MKTSTKEKQKNQVKSMKRFLKWFTHTIKSEQVISNESFINIMQKM